MMNPFSMDKQKRLSEHDIKDNLAIHLTNCMRFGACRTYNNGQTNNCHCVRNIWGYNVLQRNILACFF